MNVSQRLGLSLHLPTLLISLAALAGLASAASAATLVVTNTADSGTGSLRAAIATANADPAGDVITFDPTVFKAGSPQTITLLSTTGTLVINQSITIQGPGAAILTLNGGFIQSTGLPGGGGQPGVTIFQITSGTVSLSGLTLTAGGTIGTGAIANDGDLSVFNCIFTHDNAAISNSGTITLTNCLLSRNIPNYGCGALSNGGTATLTGCLITQNSGNPAPIDIGGTATFTACTITQNTGNLDYCPGGIENSGTLSLTNCTVSGNGHVGAQYPDLPGIQNDSGGLLHLTNCTLTGNVTGAPFITQQSGAGLENKSGGTAVVTSCILTGVNNNAPSGITGTFISGGSNLLEDPNAAADGFTGPHDQVGVTSFGLDPEGLQYNGGPTPTIGVVAGSPAIGGDFNDLTTSDQRGVARPASPAHDTIGAYEGSVSAHTQILWNKTDGTASLWKVPSDGSAPITHTYGPYSGWTAKAIAEMADGTVELLWTKTDGTVSLWNVANDGSFTENTYGPYPGWTVVSVSASSNGTGHLLWDRFNGEANLWTVSTTGAGSEQIYYGPYPGWTATAIADGPDVTDLLWTNVNGQASGWRINTSGVVSRPFGPYTGWAAKALSVGPDDDAHLLWDKTSGPITGTASLWNADFGTGVFTSPLYGPFGGWSATAIATDGDNVTHILWSHAPDGEASLWNMGSSVTHQEYGPFAGWTAIAVTAGP